MVGALVGANGIILSYIMCKAMNRSLNNVLFGAFAARKKKAEGVVKGEVKPISPADAFLILESARSVVIAPGYGLAVAQAQHAVRELGELLENARRAVLSDRQDRIVEMWTRGHTVPEIADTLGMSLARVSDDKYKALRKLEKYLAGEALVG